jgi:hypothetical protein
MQSSQDNFIDKTSNIISIKKETKIYVPGIYDISNDEYHSSNGVSRSALMLFKKSPLHYADKYIHGNNKKDTKAISVGKAVHKYILEPNKFNDEYYVADKVDRRTTEGRKRYNEMLCESNNKELILADDFNLIESLGNAILNHHTASLFLKDAKVEKSIYWRDCLTDVMVKCRPDILLSNITADIKTTEDASYKEFTRDVFKYGYHIQAAMMQDGIYHVLNKKIETFVFIAVEKKPPYAVAIYSIGQDVIEFGHKEYKETLKEFRDHQETNDWSGYKTQTINLPAYYQG